MARFTFAAGNAGKLLRLPLYGLGALAAVVVPRSRRLWAFGSGTGPGEGALPLYRVARDRLPRDHRLVWLAGSDTELMRARGLGLDAVRRGGPRGWWITLRARVLVVTHGFGDVNRYGTRGAFVVQLWHGIPLKRLHLDSPVALRVGFLPDRPIVRRVVGRAYRTAAAGIGLFPVASALVGERIRTAFGLPADRIVVTGDPRDDVLAAPDPDRREAARSLVESAVGPLPADARVVLYAPTWRDGASDPAAPTDDEWERIAAWAGRTRSVLLVRTHPLGLGDYSAGPARSDRIRLLEPDALHELTPALGAVDVLVTDYSSAAFDFSLLERPIVFLARDIEEYAKRRGLYTPYREFTGDQHVDDWDAAIARVDAVTTPGSPAAEEARRHARRLRDEHVDMLGGGATERVFAEILARVGLPASIASASTTAESSGRRIPRPVVRSLALTDGAAPALRLTLEFPSEAAEGLVLEGARAHVPATLEHAADGSVRAVFPLLVSRWGVDGLAPPSGRYRLRLQAGHGAVDRQRSSRVDAASGADAAVLDHPLFRATTRATAGGLEVDVAPPLGPDERGRAAQRRLERQYRTARPEAEDAVFLESFYSQVASDNPLGIDRALAAVRPGTRRYWSVVDRSVAVPDGAIPVVEGSREWWRVRASARALIVNDWLRKRYRPRRHQHVLQTWHGTMLKRLALDRPGRGGIAGRVLGARTRVAIRRERRRWDVLLAQNEYSATIFRRAYAMDGPIWVEGYPRNDVLADPDRAGRADAVRRRLGIPPAARVVLYAPTWRDDRTEMVEYIDPVRFAATLGDDHVLLARGHARTLRFGHDLDAAGLVDVTSYPQLSELLLVADVLVTDYSSVMFDWMSTDRPIVYFTPDLEHYSNRLRGFYFDLLAEAPGPVVRDAAALRAAILDADAAAAGYAERRAAWRERFTPRDDGSAGARVVEQMVAEGWFD